MRETFSFRLQLAHNLIWQIPPRIVECTPLKYLNLRANRLKEFPKAVRQTALEFRQSI